MTPRNLLVVVGIAGGALLAGCGDDNTLQTPAGPTTAPPAETTPANRAPQASGSIPAQILTASGDPTMVDVAPYFSDPDGNTLTYMATTSDPEAVQATVSGSIVTLTVLADREATVNVTATDPGGLTATQLVRYRTIWEALEPGGSGDECMVGQVLNPGDFCTVDIPGVSVGTNRFEVRSDGRGCYGNICSSRSLNLSGFQASRQNGNNWRIDAVPGGGGGKNSAPEAVGSIPAQTLTAGGTAGSVNAGRYFRDPDGETLTYTARSGRSGVVTAGVSGSTVTLTPVAAGTATVTVTARDPGGLSATQSIAVTVQAGGSGDECMVGQVLNPGDFCTVDIPGVSVGTNRFEVRSDGRGCYGNICSSRSLNLSGFQASRQNGNNWRIDAVPGGGGGKNSAPEAVGSIPAQTLTAGGTAGSVNAGRYFRDPDGETLTYTARSGRSGVVTAGVSGSTVTLTPVAAGTATVTVTARDPGGLSATQSIAVTVQAGGPALEGEITVCHGTRQQFSGLVDVGIEGTVRARREVSFVRATGEANGELVGIDVLGSMSSGESKSFEISGFISTSASTLTCTVELEWTEFSSDASGRSNGQVIAIHAIGALH